MRTLLFVALCLNGINVFSQNLKHVGSEYTLAWSRGQVIFKSGDTLDCLVRYNVSASHATLQISRDQHTLTVNPSDVNMFSFFDSTRMKIRSFVTCKVEGQSNKVFLENIYADSRFGLLNHKTYGIPYEYLQYTRFISKPTKINRKYLFDFSNGMLVPASKENLLRLLQAKREQLTSFINQHHLKFRKTADYVALLQYHSSL